MAAKVLESDIAVEEVICSSRRVLERPERL
jgi:hypothetical protein